MSIDNQQEYKTGDGSTISIQRSIARMTWEVACWKSDDTCHWYKEFKSEASAKKEFERFRHLEVK